MRALRSMTVAPSSKRPSAARRLSWQALRLGRSTSGSMLPLVALAMPVLIGFVGMGLETGSWFMLHERMQNAADSAALAAGRAYKASSSANLTAQASATAASYNFTTANGSVVTVNRAPLTGTYAGDTNAVEVIITQTQTRTFSSIFTNAAVTIKGRSVARINAPPTCLIVLNSSASGALSLSGNSTITLGTCDAKVNSSNSGAVTGSGGARLSAQNVYVNGGESLSGGATVSVTGTNQTAAGGVSDPYVTDSYPVYSGCDYTNYSTSGTVTLDPGVYCGGLSVAASGHVTLNPGVYYIDRGTFGTSGTSSISCTGCTIVLTSSTSANYARMNISGTSTVTLTAPTTGSTAGFAIFGDRNMTAGTVQTLSGGTGLHVEGVVYIPKGHIDYSGSSTAYNGCTKLVADSITVSGTSALAGTCTGYPAQAAKSAVTLVE